MSDSTPAATPSESIETHVPNADHYTKYDPAAKELHMYREKGPWVCSMTFGSVAAHARDYKALKDLLFSITFKLSSCYSQAYEEGAKDALKTTLPV
jgi:hypothetical protein